MSSVSKQASMTILQCTLKASENGKRHEKGQQAVQDQSMTMERSWMMIKDRTDKEHEEQKEACSMSEGRHNGRIGL